MEIIFLRQAYRFIKKADQPLKDKIKEEVLKIAHQPKIGEQLSGRLKSLRSHHFHFVRTQYRIAYTIKNNLMIITIATRENFYRDLVE